MTFDLIALVVVGLFALWGAFSGFARQVAQLLAGVAAVVAAAPAGRALGEPFARGLKASLSVGVIVATVVAFVVVYLVLRAVVTAVIRRALSGKDPQNRGADRALGFALGGAKAAALIFIGVCGVIFVENNLVFGGHKYSFAPKDSHVAALARAHNLFEWVQFSRAKDLLAAARLARDPQAASKLKDDPDFAALMKDPRFKQLAQGDAWKKALETGDVRALMHSNPLVELIYDPQVARHLEALARRAN